MFGDIWMKNHLAQTAIALLFLTATNAHAACTRDDITFYLSKGFTQEQIAAICTEETEAAAPSTPRHARTGGRHRGGATREWQ